MNLWTLFTDTETLAVLTVEGVAAHGTSLRQIEAVMVHQHREVGQAGTVVRQHPTRPIPVKHAHQIIEETLGGRHRIGINPDSLWKFV